MICIVSSSHFPDDERIYQRQIKSLVRNNRKVLYLTRSKSTINLSTKLILHKNFNVSLSIFLSKVKKIIKINKSLEYLQVHETNLLPLIKFMKRYEKSLNTIYDVHEDMESLYRTFSKRNFLIKEVAIFFRKVREDHYLKYVDSIILANPTIDKDAYKNKRNEKVVIENFPGKKFISTSSNKFNTDPMIIYHGHLAPERGITDLILAMKEVIEKVPQAKLTLLGSFRIAEYKKEVKSLISIHSLEKNIIIKKQIPHEEVWKVLSSSSIGVIPFRENLLTIKNTPTKLFEMMASGLAIVATDLPPIRNFIEDTVFWAKPSSPRSLALNILESINNEDANSKIKKNLKMINKKYNWEKIENRYLSIFS